MDPDTSLGNTSDCSSEQSTVLLVPDATSDSTVPESCISPSSTMESGTPPEIPDTPLDAFFETSVDKIVPKRAIYLVDSSGSTVANRGLIFNRMKDLIKKYLSFHDINNFLFWNSPNVNDTIFKNGVHIVPCSLGEEEIDTVFWQVQKKISNNCATATNIAFSEIPDYWFRAGEVTQIYLVTDGEMGWRNISYLDASELRGKLTTAIKKITSLHHVKLDIITVEDMNRDFDIVETIRHAAGCDVYNVIMENKLTEHVQSFVCYTNNHPQGYVQLQRETLPPGFLCYHGRVFSETKMSDFIRYIHSVVQTKKNNRDELLHIIQDLTGTLAVFFKGRSPQIVHGASRNFILMFADTDLDLSFVSYMLHQSIDDELTGRTAIFTSYRARMNDIYRQANDLLNNDVANAVGMTDSFLTLPYNGIVLSGSSSMVGSSIQLNGGTYPNSCIELAYKIPVLPLNGRLSNMNQQCLRQWIRNLYTMLYNVSVTDESIVYLMLKDLLHVRLSDMPGPILRAYQTMALNMLRKKSYNSAADTTDLERLETGALPSVGFYNSLSLMKQLFEGLSTPSSSSTSSTSTLTSASSSTSTSSSSSTPGEGRPLRQYTIWYALCLATGNQMLINKQLIHCTEDIQSDFPGIDPIHLLDHLHLTVPPLQHATIPETVGYEYTCLITLDDTSGKGGYRFLPHENSIGNHCRPRQILSIEGYRQLLNPKVANICPICFSQLTTADFAPVGPKGDFDLNTIYPQIDDRQNVFSRRYTKLSLTNTSKSSKAPITASTFKSSASTATGQCYVVVLRGTVGCGKSSITNLLVEKLQKRGAEVIIAGTDRLCTDQGHTPKTAIGPIKAQLLAFETNPAPFKVVIVDTCGERTSSDVFGLSFNGWKRITLFPNLDRTQLLGYLCWSLRNVLRRPPATPGCGYYLSTGAGLKVCCDVHQTKARAHFQKAMPVIPRGATIPATIALLNENADNYQRWLDENGKTVEGQVNEILNQIQ